MNTDKHGWLKKNLNLDLGKRERSGFLQRAFKNQRFFLGLSVFICVHLWLTCVALAGPLSTPVPSVDSAFDAAAKALDQSKDEVQKFKDVWDKTRLETTLYDQRAKRAFKKYVKAVKGARETAKEQKEKAGLEFQLAVEKRKLAYNEWQAAQLRMMASESQLKALDQDKDSEAIREKIKQLEAKVGKSSSVVRSPSSAKPNGEQP